ncbi:unnamed protein product [Urochloa humidicola]
MEKLDPVTEEVARREGAGGGVDLLGSRSGRDRCLEELRVRLLVAAPGDGRANSGGVGVAARTSNAMRFGGAALLRRGGPPPQLKPPPLVVPRRPGPATARLG